jgi:hemolysin activation/secretion protein
MVHRNNRENNRAAGTIKVVMAVLALGLVWAAGNAFGDDGAPLPSDMSVKFIATELVVQGNARISTTQLLGAMPPMFNVTGKPVKGAKAEDLYDLRPVRELWSAPGKEHAITVRTIQGFTKYVSSEYKKRNLSGVYVFVPAASVLEGIELKDKKLVIEVLEAAVGKVGISVYNLEKQKKETSYLNQDVMKGWSPAKEGRMMSDKKVDMFVNEMNLNPDKHVAAVVSRGEDKTLNVNYDLYERTPWHYFLAADSSGTDKRQWSPRAGIINTDLTGRMDRATLMYQAKLDDLQDNYALYGSYEVPLWTPALKLNLFGGYSEYDTNPVGTSPFIFQGKGSFYGGKLRYNLLQVDKWFFDVTGGLTHERSEYTPNLFANELASDLKINYWSVGAELYKNEDLTDTRFSFERYTSFGGSSDADFNKARLNTDSRFYYYVLAGSRSQFLDLSRVHRVVASCRYIIPGERLTPSAMTTFGGLYSVRGYHEDEVVADGGVIASLQYEYDLIATIAKMQEKKDKTPSKELVRRLAPVVFTDWGRAINEEPVAGEHGIVEMASIGTGLVTTIGDNFDGAIYYGWALRGTDNTSAGDGHWGASLLLRW